MLKSIIARLIPSKSAPAKPARVESATIAYLRLAQRAIRERDTHTALFWLRAALGNANRENDPVGKAVCMRLLNRVRRVHRLTLNERLDRLVAEVMAA